MYLYESYTTNWYVAHIPGVHVNV